MSSSRCSYVSYLKFFRTQIQVFLKEYFSIVQSALLTIKSNVNAKRERFSCKLQSASDKIVGSIGLFLSGKYIVQCKDWQGNIGVKIIRELYGVVEAEDANKGILIASSQFTKSAIQFAQNKRLELIDGEQLDELIKRSAAKVAE